MPMKTSLFGEIADMPLHLQAKLLRMLQERQVERICSAKARVCDLRRERKSGGMDIAAPYRKISGAAWSLSRRVYHFERCLSL